MSNFLYIPTNPQTGARDDIYFTKQSECKQYCTSFAPDLVPHQFSQLVIDDRFTVAYAADRNLYPYLPTVVNSLLTNNPRASVYIFAEDDSIPQISHSNVTIINWNIFKDRIEPSSPQFKYYLPFPTFIRLWMADVLPESKVLWLDVDTLVDGELDELEDLEMGNNIIAAVLDCGWRNYPEISDMYINAGVILFNLDEWRRLNLTEISTHLLNTKAWKFGDQDIINYLCKRKTFFLNPRYNQGRYIKTDDTIQPIKIYHWPGAPKQWEQKTVKDKVLWQKYYTPELKT